MRQSRQTRAPREPRLTVRLSLGDAVGAKLTLETKLADVERFVRVAASECSQEERANFDKYAAQLRGGISALQDAIDRYRWVK